MPVDMDRRMPSQPYRVVAELLAWIYRIAKRDAARGSAYPPWGAPGTAPPAPNLEAPAR
jgi:hypothetical protein